MYRDIIFSTLLFGAETWTVYKVDAQRFHVYIIRYLFKILNVKWWQQIPNKSIQEKSKLLNMYNILNQRHLAT